VPAFYPTLPTPAARVVIRGWGLLTPLGYSAWETFTAVLAGRTIADRCEALTDAVGPVELVRAVGSVGVAQHAAGDPSVELAERAVREACGMAGVAPAGLCAFIGTSKGAVASLPAARGQATFRGMGDAAEAVARGPHGYLTARLRERLGLGMTHHHVAACASGLVALDAARRSLLHAAADGPSLAIAMTSEAALLPAFVHSYRRLGVLAPLSPQGYRQRPLHADRAGFMLSEAGAAAVLERLPPGVEPQIGQIELLGTGVAAEADDLIRPSPTMAALDHVARELFSHPAAADGIDLLHPHAPGTADHDPTEWRVLHRAARAIAGRTPDAYAAKGAIGHSLGAAGLSALVLACLCLTTGRRPPMPWLDAAMEGVAVNPGGCACSRTGTHAVFAAGFAGHVAGALVRRW
jgi:3-oxoacyl-[acyl-carrier-protein] synthase II